MSQQIINYLKNIDAGKVINLDAFLKAITGTGLNKSEAVLAIKSNKLSKNGYIVTSITDDFRKKLDGVAIPKSATRNEAALKGLSHSVGVDGSMLIMRNGEGHPSVVVIDGGGMPSLTSSNSELVIIENEQNFIHIENTATFMRTHCELELLGKDVIYGMGSSSCQAGKKECNTPIFRSNYS